MRNFLKGFIENGKLLNIIIQVDDYWVIEINWYEENKEQERKIAEIIVVYLLNV